MGILVSESLMIDDFDWLSEIWVKARHQIYNKDQSYLEKFPFNECWASLDRT